MGKRIKATALLVITATILSSCSDIQEANNINPETTVAIAIKPITVIAESTATPEPVILVRKPVKGRSPMRIQTDAPAELIPEFYQPVDLKGIDFCVYAFTAQDGATRFRVYAMVDELEDENVMNTLSGFFQAKVTLNERGNYVVETSKEDYPINVLDEDPAELKICPVPFRDNINSYIRAAEKAKKEYDKAVQKAEEKDEPLPEPTPWDGLPILSKETVPQKIPSQIKKERKIESLYYYVNRSGDNEYRRYATPNGMDSGFYLSDENGFIKPGALMVNIKLDFIKENFRSGKKLDRPSDNTYRLPVLIRLSDCQEVPVYTVYTRTFE